MRVFIGLGSNLEEPKKQLDRAVKAMRQLSFFKVIQVSSYYLSKPVGFIYQPDFINGVVEAETTLSPGELLKTLQAIENQQQRTREFRFAPRTLDLDILLYENVCIHSEDLIIPHPGLKERAFVIFPLSEIAPDLVLPSGERIMDLKNLFSCHEIEKCEKELSC